MVPEAFIKTLKRKCPQRKFFSLRMPRIVLTFPVCILSLHSIEIDSEKGLHPQYIITSPGEVGRMGKSRKEMKENQLLGADNFFL